VKEGRENTQTTRDWRKTKKPPLPKVLRKESGGKTGRGAGCDDRGRYLKSARKMYKHENISEGS